MFRALAALYCGVMVGTFDRLVWPALGLVLVILLGSSLDVRAEPASVGAPPADASAAFGARLLQPLAGANDGRMILRNGERSGSWLFARTAHLGASLTMPIAQSGAGGFPSASAAIAARSDAVLTQGNTHIAVEATVHTDEGRVTLQLPRAFKPGLYTVALPGGTFATVQQDFAWGVLAVNPDRDRYLPGETAHVAFGVLDRTGEIVCDADLSLTVRAPDGSVTLYSTRNGGVTVTGTCGLKQPGSISPDYEARVSLSAPGDYLYDVLAVTANGSWTVAGVLPVRGAPPLIVERSAATRLWPVASSDMTITVRFLRAFRGLITDVLPRSFSLEGMEPQAREAVSGEERTVAWEGAWKAGETVRLRYTYDAPDVTPEFFLLGPLQFREQQSGAPSQELRQWQIANDGFCGDYVCDAGEEGWCGDCGGSSSSSSEPSGACCYMSACTDYVTQSGCYGTFHQDTYCSDPALSYCTGGSSGGSSSASARGNVFFFLGNATPRPAGRLLLCYSIPAEGGSRGFL